MGLPHELYIELFGTLLNIWCVWPVAQKEDPHWPVGSIVVVIFIYGFCSTKFSSIRILLNKFYFITGFYAGWFV